MNTAGRTLSRRAYRFASIFCWALMLQAVSPKASAAFIGAYSPNNWTLVNSNADGTVTADPGGAFITLTGGNNGSGTPGTTDYTTLASQSGTIQFDFLYSSNDDAGFDWAGYLVGGVFVQLADASGLPKQSATFNVTQGEQFGFRVGTADNGGEPGVLTVSAFSAPA